VCVCVWSGDGTGGREKAGPRACGFLSFCRLCWTRDQHASLTGPGALLRDAVAVGTADVLRSSICSRGRTSMCPADDGPPGAPWCNRAGRIESRQKGRN
jgi:hypothetical protein